MKWFFIFLCVPIIEITLLFKINDMVGIFYTVLTIIITALIGTFLVKKQGRELIFTLRKQGSNPINLLGNGLFILIAGVLLLTPGFLTDIIGFLILTPPIRIKIMSYLSTKFSPSKTNDYVRNDPW